MSHSSDFAIGPLLSILAASHISLVPANVKENLRSFQGEHTFSTTAYSPPYDYAVRNITTWVSESITIGATSFDQSVVGGSSEAPGSWSPAVIQWYNAEGADIGFIVVCNVSVCVNGC